MHDKVLVIETAVSNISLSNPLIQKALLENCENYDLIFFKKKHYHIFDTDLIKYLRKNKKFPKKEFGKKIIPCFVKSLINPFPKGKFEKQKIGEDFVLTSENEYFVLPKELFLSVKEINEIEDCIENEKQNEKFKEIISRNSKGLGFLEILFKDENLQDIFLNSPNSNPLYVFHSNLSELMTNIYLTDSEIERICTYLRFNKNRAFDESNPKIDTNIGNVRVCGIMNPLAEGVGFAFRRHKINPLTLTQIVDLETASFLSFLVDNPVSILIAGPRGSGKTSLLGALLAEINRKKRIVVIEDTEELPCKELIKQGFNIQRLTVRPPVSKNDFELSAEDALRTALRLGESVLVVGEVRGKEAKTLFEAMRIGAAGSSVLGTIHSSSAEDVFDRIVNDLEVPRTSFKAVDLIITLGQTSDKEYGIKKRNLLEINEVLKGWNLKPEFRKLAYFDFKNKKLIFNDLKNSPLIKKICKINGMTLNDFKKSMDLRKKMKQGIESFESVIEVNDKIRKVIMNGLY